MMNFNRNGFQQMLQGMMQQGGQNPSAFVNGFLRDNPRFAQQIQGRNVQQEAANALLKMGYPAEQIRQMFPNAKF